MVGGRKRNHISAVEEEGVHSDRVCRVPLLGLNPTCPFTAAPVHAAAPASISNLVGQRERLTRMGVPGSNLTTPLISMEAFIHRRTARCRTEKEK